MNLARFEVFVDELFACLHFFEIHWIGLGYLRNKGFFEIYGMVKRLLRRELSVFWFVKDLGVLGVLWRKFLFHFLCSLGEGSGKSELSEVGVVFS